MILIFTLSLFLLVSLLIVIYKTVSVRFTENRTGHIEVRIGWSSYIAKDDHVYKVSDDFAYHEELVDSKAMELYVLRIIKTQRSAQRPDETITKRFLRKF